MSFGFKDMVFGTLCPIYGAYKLSTTDMKEYKKFAQKALYCNADGSFNPVKTAVHSAVPLMAGISLWQNTGKEVPPNPYGTPVYSYPSYVSSHPAGPAVGVGS
jgi:hypothetical protein